MFHDFADDNNDGDNTEQIKETYFCFYGRHPRAGFI